MLMIQLPQEVRFQGYTLVLPQLNNEVDPNREAFFILDFDRKFEDPDLNKRPVKIAYVANYQDRYLLFKYNIVIGSLSEL